MSPDHRKKTSENSPVFDFEHGLKVKRLDAIKSVETVPSKPPPKIRVKSMS